MEQYIKKSAVVAEINRVLNSYDPNEITSGRYALVHLRDFLDTLEVKEEILDKKSKTNLMRKCVHKAYKRGYDMGVLQTTNKIKHNTKKVDLEKEVNQYYEKTWPFEEVDEDIIAFARHFYELGIKSQTKDMQDALRMEYEKGRADVIEKACKFLKSYRQDTLDGTGYISGIINDETIEEFKKVVGK